MPSGMTHLLKYAIVEDSRFELGKRLCFKKVEVLAVTIDG